MNAVALRDFLDRKVEEYNRPSFIKDDPISVPHCYTLKQDIEISGFFAATFAWGNRTTIINKCKELMKLMDNAPHQFVTQHQEKDLRRFEGFCHRTFNTTDLLYFILFLRSAYQKHHSLEDVFFFKENNDVDTEPVQRYLEFFYGNFFSLEDVPLRTMKHVAAPSKHSACKRLNMFLRWMVRDDNKGVDFGIWKKIKPQHLICPLDLHVARVAKKFGLIDRPNADWQAALNLTQHLRTFDAQDPAKYDFALFALGVIEKF